MTEEQKQLVKKTRSVQDLFTILGLDWNTGEPCEPINPFTGEKLKTNPPQDVNTRR